MPTTKLLNYQFHAINNSQISPTLVFIHGLFGDMNNLGVIARALFPKNTLFAVLILRNHGQSFHSEE